jgi:hypothetical protein
MSTHSSRTKSREVKTTIKETKFLCVFDKNDASKNKVKAKLKHSKGCACKTPLAEVLIFVAPCLLLKAELLCICAIPWISR